MTLTSVFPLAEQVSDLGLGQINAPRVARMDMDVDEMNDMIEGAFEDSFVASFGLKGPLWAHEPPWGTWTNLVCWLLVRAGVYSSTLASVVSSISSVSPI